MEEEEPNHLHSNSRFLKRRFTSQEFWSTRKARDQLILPHDLSLHGAEIRRDANYQFQEAKSIGKPPVIQHQPWRSASMVQIFLIHKHQVKPKASKKFSLTSFSRFSPVGPHRWKRGGICSSQNLILAFKSLHHFRDTQKLLSTPRTLPSW